MDCGSRRCAVEAEAAKSTDMNNLAFSITRGLQLARGRVYKHIRPDGSGEVSVVSAREGYDLHGNERGSSAAEPTPAPLPPSARWRVTRT